MTADPIDLDALRKLAAEATLQDGVLLPIADLPTAIDRMSSVVAAAPVLIAEVERLQRRVTDLETCSTCGGDPQSHPSELPCVCVDGTASGEVKGLRLAAAGVPDPRAAR